MFKADDYRMRAKLLSDTLAETKEALDIDILREQLAQLKVEQEKPEVWQDLECSAKLGREIASVEGKVNAYDKGNKALEEVNEVIDLIEETGEEELVPELDKLLETAEADLEDMRIRALLRRARIASDHKLNIGATELDYDAMTIRRGSDKITLPPKEFLLLYKLLSYPNKIFTRIQLLEDIWGPASESTESTVSVHINRLRNHFEHNPDFQIITIRGLGYKAQIREGDL